MKKLKTALISSVCAAAMLAGTVMPASACDLTPEELFEKYDFTYKLKWNEKYGYYLWGSGTFDITHYDLDGNYLGLLRYMDNPYRICYNISSKEFHPDYNCEYEDGFYYAIKDDGTAVIAGCEYDYIMERMPTAITIPEELGGAVVTEIAERAFSDAKRYMKELICVSIPDTVEVIGEYAFCNVFDGDALNCSINMPANVKYIGSAAFTSAGWAFGKRIVLPESVEYVSGNAFSGGQPPIQMPESLVFTEYIVIGTPPFYVTVNEPRESELEMIQKSVKEVYVQGKYNTVSLYDVRKYLLDKMSQQWNDKLIGDLDANGKIDILDAVLLARAVGGTYALSADESLAADLNGDGNIDAADLTALMNLLSGN